MSGQGCNALGRDVSVGDPGAFANEMAKLINAKEYRLVLQLEGKVRHDGLFIHNKRLTSHTRNNSRHIKSFSVSLFLPIFVTLLS
jgi:hypothetical protein